jgi:hypothetical protein
MTDDKLDLVQGTLDVMVLQTLSAMGPMLPHWARIHPRFCRRMDPAVVLRSE